MELEFTLLILYLRNENEIVRKIFKKLQPTANNLRGKIYNIAWDIFHIRLLEQNFLNDCIKHKDKIYLHYFTTADIALKEVLKANPLKMIVYNKGNIVSIRKYNTSVFLMNQKRNYIFQKKL